MFFKPMKINFIAASSFGNDWAVFYDLLNRVVDRLRGNFVSRALVVYTAFRSLYGTNRAELWTMRSRTSVLGNTATTGNPVSPSTAD
jgi:hypothetical protein